MRRSRTIATVVAMFVVLSLAVAVARGDTSTAKIPSSLSRAHVTTIEPDAFAHNLHGQVHTPEATAPTERSAADTWMMTHHPQAAVTPTATSLTVRAADPLETLRQRSQRALRNALER